MVYPTPGFVVKSTFLEFENPDSPPQATNPIRLHRSHSDSELSRRVKEPQIFGSEEMRKWWERRRATAATASTKQDLDNCSTSCGSDADARSDTPSKEQALDISRGLNGAEELDAIQTQTLPGTALQVELTTTEQSCEDALRTLDSHGLRGCYNFVYVPVDLQTKMPLHGHALVNFASPDMANLALERLNRRATPYQHCKSLADFVDRYRNSPVMHESVDAECKPKVFEAGAIVPFPPPTIKIRAPRTRGKHNKAQPNNKDTQLGVASSSAKASKPPRRQQPSGRASKSDQAGTKSDFRGLQAQDPTPLDWFAYQQAGSCVHPMAANYIQLWQ